MSGGGADPPAAPAARRDLADGLARLSESMRSMVERARRSLGGALQALDGPDGAAIDSVLRLDGELYDLKQKVVKTCVELLALHAPVAVDLRHVTADLEIASDLDRIGRYSKDIVEIVRDLPREEPGAFAAVPVLRQIGQLTERMLETVTDAYLRDDAGPVHHVEEDDNAIDELHEQIFRLLVGRIADQSLTPSTGAGLILVNRYFERIADHAVNIGGQVEYRETGVRHRW
jgi:phosphate transport system protein